MLGTRSLKDLCDVLRLQLVVVNALVLMASCMMGCDCNCGFVMLRKRVDGNPKYVEKLLFSN